MGCNHTEGQVSIPSLRQKKIKENLLCFCCFNADNFTDQSAFFRQKPAVLQCVFQS